MPEGPDIRGYADIDKHRLDEEWVDHVKLYAEVAEQLAEARFRLAEAKGKVEFVEAELAMKIRANPDKYRIEGKLTEKAIEVRVLVSKVRQEAVKEKNEAQHAVDVLQGASDLLEHRKKALENLVVLHGRDYFSAPSQKGLNQEVRDRLEDTSTRKAFRKGKKT